MCSLPYPFFCVCVDIEEVLPAQKRGHRPGRDGPGAVWGHQLHLWPADQLSPRPGPHQAPGRR